MTKKWMIIHNAIATILLAWALFFVYSFTDSVFMRALTVVKTGFVKQSDVSYVKLFGSYNVFYLCGILAGYAGAALIFEKKWGWLAAVASSLIFMAFMFVSARDGLTADNNTKGGEVSLSYLATGFVFAAMFILLVLKPFRTKYQPTFLNWLSVGGIILLVILDKQLFLH